MIFVFGSNLAGRHGAGAALEALRLGFPMHLGVGLCSRCYALPTKDHEIRSLPLHVVRLYVNSFMAVADNAVKLQFKVTRVGCGLAGFSDEEIAPLFVRAPLNCHFDTKWREYLPSLTNYWGTYP